MPWVTGGFRDTPHSYAWGRDRASPGPESTPSPPLEGRDCGPRTRQAQGTHTCRLPPSVVQQKSGGRPGSLPSSPAPRLLPRDTPGTGCHVRPPGRPDSGQSEASSEAPAAVRCRTASPAPHHEAGSVPQGSRFKVRREGLQTKRILCQECLCDAVWSLKIEPLFYRNKESNR